MLFSLVRTERQGSLELLPAAPTIRQAASLAQLAAALIEVPMASMTGEQAESSKDSKWLSSTMVPVISVGVKHKGCAALIKKAT